MASFTSSFGGFMPRYSDLSLNGLADVKIPKMPQHGDALVYCVKSKKWKPKSMKAKVSKNDQDGDSSIAVDDLENGLIVREFGATTVTDTLPSASEIGEKFGSSDGSSFRFTVQNNGGAALTIAPGDGATMSGSDQVAAGTSATFMGVFNESEELVVYSV